MLNQINSQVVHIRQNPDAETKKKMENILKEGRKGRQDRAAAGAQDGATAGVNDRADSICWFCHDDVTNLENNKCAGCRKVTHSIKLQILSFKNLFRGALL